MRFFGRTETGPVRKTNQDCFFASLLDNGVFIGAVCDGMGGAAAGNIASDTACVAIRTVLENSVSSGFSEGFDFYGALRAALSDANAKICEKVNMNPDFSGMGTTAVAVMAYNGKAYVANVGDSRCYALTDGTLEQITKDHSYVQMLVDSGSLTEDEAAHHPQKNIITRSLGDTPDAQADLFSTDTKKTTLLLCSDGLTNFVSEDFIREKLLKSADTEKCANILIDEAVKNGGGDNITVLIVDFADN